MKKIITLLVLLVSVNGYTQQFTRWTFDDGDGDGSSGTVLPVLGDGIITTIGSVSQSFEGGIGGGDDSRLLTNVYPAQGTNNGTAGIEFSFSTNGKDHIAIGWDQGFSVGSSKYFQVLYSVNGSAYNAVDLTNKNVISKGLSTGLSGEVDISNDILGAPLNEVYRWKIDLSQLELNGIVNIRIVSVFEPNTISYTGPVGEYNTNDNVSFDNIVIGGTDGETGYHTLANGDFFQDWSDIVMIAVDNNWGSVPSIIGYSGAGYTGIAEGTDPQSLIEDDPLPSSFVIANQGNAGDLLPEEGLAEFENGDAVIGIRSYTAGGAPYIILHLNTIGRENIQLSYTARDIDAVFGDDGTQSIAVQYRIGTVGEWTNLPAAFINDVAGPGATLVINQNNILLPTFLNDQPAVQLRFITISDASDIDGWMGIDNIQVTSAVLLPLQLTSFTASTTSQQVNLQWQTTNEINVDKFLVEKSTNGNNYTVVGTVTAQNKEANQYSYTTPLTQGNSYYRLKMLDKDGSYSYSNIVTVEGNTTNQLKAYPSLVTNGNLVINHSKATTGAIISIYAINGALVQQQRINKDAVQTSLNVSSLSAGSYKLIYSNNKTQQQTSFIKE